MQKKKRRHLSKEELLYHMRGMSRMERFSGGVAYHDSAILVNYILYTEFGFRQKKITEFNELILKKYRDNKSQDEINERLNEKADFIIGYHYVTGKDIEKTGNKFIDSKRMKMLDVDNDIQGEFEKYMRYSYDALMDMGFGKIRLIRFRYFAENYSKEVSARGIDAFASTLFDKIGLVIAYPEGF